MQQGRGGQGRATTIRGVGSAGVLALLLAPRRPWPHLRHPIIQLHGVRLKPCRGGILSIMR